MTKAAAAKAAEAAAKAAEAAATALDIIIDEDWEWRLKDLPEFATATGDHRYDDRLDDRSLAAYDQRIKWSKSVLVRVKAWEHKFGSGSGSGSGSDGGSGGDPPQELADARVSARLLAHHARSVCEGGQFGTFLCPINRLEGPHTELPQLIEYMKFETLKDYEKYVSRLKGVPLALAQVTALLKRGVVTGMLPPLVGLEGVADQLASVVAYLAPGKVKESPFGDATSAAVAAAGATLEGEAAALAAARDSFECCGGTSWMTTSRRCGGCAGRRAPPRPAAGQRPLRVLSASTRAPAANGQDHPRDGPVGGRAHARCTRRAW